MLRKRCVLVVCDSLRNDFVGAGTPVLDALAREGARFVRARAVFPSTTRVSAASIATGCHPREHGLLGNTMVLREADGLRVRSVGKPVFREQLRAATGGHLRVPTLAARLRAEAGAASAIYSNVSPGAAYFFDPECHGHVYHRAGSYAPGGAPLAGDRGLRVEPGAGGDRIMTHRFCEHLIADDSLAFAALWLSEPDASGHAQVLGSAEHRAAIGHAEACVAEVAACVARLRERGEDVLLMVGSDHGMETVCREVDIARELVEAGLKASPDSREIVVAPNGTAAVLAFDEEYAHAQALLRWLPAQPWVGEFAAGAALEAWGVPDEPACRVAISLAGSDEANPAGVPGFAWYAVDPDEPKNYLGFGQHGGRHAHESHPFLIVQGPGFAPGEEVPEPVSLVDYAPTVLRHLGLPGAGMRGRPLQTLMPRQAGTASP